MSALAPDTLALLKRLGKAFNAGDADAILACVTDDFEWIMARGPDAPDGRVVRGREAVREAPQSISEAHTASRPLRK